jgi:hypothetical protein
MRCNLGSACAFTPNLLKMLFDLRTPRTRCFQILLRVPLNLGLPMSTTLDLVTKLL